MFGAKYSRLKFWIVSLTLMIVGSFVMAIIGRTSGELAESLFALFIYVPLLSVLANRIRAFGSNPWLALWAVLPFVGLFQALYYGCKKSKNNQ